ncbi:putative thioredoxin [Microbacteriaceae bacterium SG_E_30_P1]|uniref:Thioredoxin n=1 Tax=Antiquaquibacter oligotrophicus TaxID=2880260 RepID=A0ABT6KNN3_9MICO|nr:tetratricopeptide repeat protein [Antiquaquibacter oligotrophicus]MDH6181391.1 putative thioredoxin [Antiquaquibacter oligotrophicus]UDF12917.1 tetratricopeptide repeat protein [Antiquaquibacter oligotrophicus]
MTNAPMGGNLRGAVDLSSLVRPANPEPAASGGVSRTANDSSFTAVLDLSQTVPVIVEFLAPGESSRLASIVESYNGKIAIATVDASTSPQLVQAFQVAELPTVAAVVAGRPVQLFAGVPAEEDVRSVFDQILQLAVQQGVTGTLATSETGEPTEEPLPPLHQEAYDAISAGDYARAITAYQTAIAQNPRDNLAVAGLAQVSLLSRLDGLTADQVRTAAAEKPGDADAQLAVADLDVSGGHLEDAFSRLLDLFPTLEQSDKDRVRARLLDYFEIAGVEDPRVVAARRRLTLLLF